MYQSNFTVVINIWRINFPIINLEFVYNIVINFCKSSKYIHVKYYFITYCYFESRKPILDKI